MFTHNDILIILIVKNIMRIKLHIIKTKKNTIDFKLIISDIYFKKKIIF